MKPTAFIINGNSQYKALFEQLGFNIVLNNITTKPDLYVFTGGADVSPNLYDAKKHSTTFCDPGRDVYEKEMFTQAILDGAACVGICRGGQFLNVMNDGSMYQDVEGHTRGHFITDATTGDVVYVSSTHHQMMKPSPKAVLVAYSNNGGAREWYEGNILKRDVSDKDIEVVYYPDTNSLCFQPHPEFTGAEFIGMKHYFADLLSRHLSLQFEMVEA